MRGLAGWKQLAALIGGAGSLVLFTVAILVVHFFVFGELVSELPMSTQPTTTPIALKGVRRLQLSLHASKLASGSCERLTVSVELMRGTTALFTFNHIAWSYTSDEGDAPLGSTSTLSTVDLPPEGIDAVRSSYRFEPAGCSGGVAEGLVLQLRKPRL